MKKLSILFLAVCCLVCFLTIVSKGVSGNHTDEGVNPLSLVFADEWRSMGG